MYTHSPHGSVAVFRRCSKGASAIVILIAVVVLVGWWIESKALKSLMLGPATMKANTAMAFFMAGLALWIFHIPTPSHRLTLVRAGCIALILVIAGLTLIEHAVGINLGIDQLLVQDHTQSSPYPGRMAPTSALNFLLIGMALLFLHNGYSHYVAQLLALITVLSAFLALLGYLYGIESLYRLAFGAIVAFHSTIAFIRLGIGILGIYPDRGWMSIMTSVNISGFLSRRLIPAAIIVPAVAGWGYFKGQQLHWYDPVFGVAILVIIIIMIFLILFMWCITILTKIDHSRLAAEAYLKNLHQELEQRVEERTTELQTSNERLEREIGERITLEAALRQSQEHFSILFHNSPVGISLTHRDNGNFIDVNDSFLRLIGFERDAVIGRSAIDLGLVTAETRKKNIERINETGSLYNVELPMKISSGEIRMFLFSLEVVEIDGQACNISILYDITERRRAEAALAQERDILQALMDQIPDMIYFKDTALRFTRINRAQANIIGIENPVDAIGKTNNDFHSPHLSKAVQAQEQHLLQTGHSVIDYQEFYPTADDQPRWFSATKVPMYDRDGHIQGLIGISRDITERIKSETAIQQANAQLIVRVAQMTLLNELAEQLQACLMTQEVYAVTVTLVQKIFPEMVGLLGMIKNSQNWVETMVTWGNFPMQAPLFGLDDCWALRRGHTHVMGPNVAALRCPHIQGHAVSSSICIPLLAQGEALGVLHLRLPASSFSSEITTEQQQVAHVVADSVALALANVKLRETLRQQSIRDPLTGLFNRRYMEESLEREIHRAFRTDRSVGVIMLDVDHFKQINDTHSHNIGDMVLRYLGRFLNEHTRQEDIACRYGGEEFILILPDTNLEQTRIRAEQQRAEFQTLWPHGIQAPIESLTLSFGVAAYPIHGTTGLALIQAADAALYQAKRTGRDRVIMAGKS